jgi:hypothetical protein
MARVRRSREPSFLLLVGWLFADLFLMLFVVGIASLPPMSHAAPHAATHHGHPQPPPPQTGRPFKSHVLEQHPVIFAIHIAPAEVQNQATHLQAIKLILRDIRRELAARGLLDHQAGFVLVFASGPVTAIDQAQNTARTVLQAVRRREAGFHGASGEGFWMGSNDDFDFQVFFFA